MNASAAALNEPQTQAPSPPNDGGGAMGKVPKTFFVLDTTAVRATGHDQEDKAKGRGPRTHDMIVVDGRHKIVKSYVFEPGKPLELPIEIAIKFLKTEGFIRTDAEGNPQPYHRQPKQPDELGAGERFMLDPHQTVADYGELTTMSLLQRVLELPGGEAIGDKRDREAMIDFLMKSRAAKAKANMEQRPSRTAPAAAPAAPVDEDDEFIPAAQPDDE